MTSPNKMNVGDYGIINTRSPNNAERIVQVLNDMGTFDLPDFGVQRIFKVIPVADRPMHTARTRDDGKESITYYVPTEWIVPITTEDPELDMFLLVWADDERTYRNE